MILAGITISFIVQGNSVLNQAQESKDKQKIAEIKEQIGTKLLALQVDEKVQGTSITKTDIEGILSKY